MATSFSKMFSFVIVQVIIYAIQVTLSQYQGYYQNPMAIDQGFYQEQIDYSLMDYQPTNGHYHHNSNHYGSRGGRHPIDYDYDSEECKCSCTHCDKLKPCCQQVCTNCNPPPNMYFVPYPYPIILGEPPTPSTASTTKTTTEVTTTITPKTTVVESRKATDIPMELNDVIAKVQGKHGDSKYILTSLRRTKSNWLPKYGIVPIPDQLAESLMSQMRNMKNINNHS